ncbi:MAG: DUF4982 domain-containing protein [Reichenbachiella sp.]
MKNIIILLITTALISSCAQDQGRIVEDFNQGWKFELLENNDAYKVDFDDSAWRTLNVPHDWSIEEGYKNEDGTAASTGFVVGGIGWYRKSFVLSPADKGRIIVIMFDGVYNNSTVWINGQELGTRPYGYSTFSYELTDFLKFDGTPNVLAVKVDRSAYVDSRWYTGSGIYRKVHLIKKTPLHVAQWGVQISTPTISENNAQIKVKTSLVNKSEVQNESIALIYRVYDQQGQLKLTEKVSLANQLMDESLLNLADPELWSIQNPSLYSLSVQVVLNGSVTDEVTETFGIRSFYFDSNEGFSLNGEKMKLKGVNLHHDGGAVGAAVPKAIWQYRIEKLKSIGVNAVRLSHNPHAIELLEVCDEMGMMAIDEAFDEWYEPKGKNLVYIGDNAASEEASRAYPTKFNDWAERDLKDLIRRDFNHPSVIMWSIGNEIEWTFPVYSKIFNDVNGPLTGEGYRKEPNYDSLKMKDAIARNIEGKDPLATMAKKLSNWAKEVDTSRPITCGSVLPSVGVVSGYSDAVDVMGFNYRAADYDAAHKAHPDLKIVGSENWVTYSEWKNCMDRDFVAGIFVWTGFAYLGEAGPWPRKGLNISLFDFAGFKNPRGHFFETLWKDDPKVYAVTTPADESEFSYTKENGWVFDMQLTPPPVWKMLRLWEWYKVYPKWNYDQGKDIVVQSYTNCEEAELFLNGTSLGKQKLADFSEDNIIKWLVPYEGGELKVVGYDKGQKTCEYVLKSAGIPTEIVLTTSKSELTADGYDVAVITAQLLDENGNLVANNDLKIKFGLSGEGKNIGVDNGNENNINAHKSNEVLTHNGKAVIFIQSTEQTGQIELSASGETIKSNTLSIKSK